MDPFLLYLIAVNAATFVAFAIDYLLCLKFPALDNMAANSLILDIFPLAGGAAGMLLALFLLGGLGRGHRMNKDNIAWWLLAIVCLIAWGLIAAAKFGLLSPKIGIDGLLSRWDTGKLGVLAVYLAAVNIVTFIAFVWDKHVAKNGNNPSRRLPEARLLALCLIGGSAGGLVAMHTVRHKTTKWYFTWGSPFLTALDTAAVIYVHLVGII